MSNWNGPSFKGAKRTLKAQKRVEAEVRNAQTKPERKSKKAQK